MIDWIDRRISDRDARISGAVIGCILIVIGCIAQLSMSNRTDHIVGVIAMGFGSVMLLIALIAGKSRALILILKIGGLAIVGLLLICGLVSGMM